MWRAVRKAIGDVLEEDSASESKHFSIWEEVKLNFAFSDLLRGALPELRKSTYLQNLNTALRTTEVRVAINPFEFMAAIRKWLRQLALHFGLYRYIASIQESVAAKSGSRGSRDTSTALADAMQLVAAPRQSKKRILEHSDLMMSEIMCNSRIPITFDNGVVRTALRAKFKGKLADDVKKALERLCHEDLVVQLPAAHPKDDQGPLQQKLKTKTGPKLDSYAKKPWSDIGNDPVKVAFVESLNLSRKNFP